MVIHTKDTQIGQIQRMHTLERNDPLHGELVHCALERVLRPV